MKTKIALITAMTLLAGSAVAADTGFYVGAGMGFSKWDVNKSKFTSNLNDALYPDFVVTGSSTDSNATPYTFYVGYKFMPYLAAELAWLDNGSVSYKANFDYNDLEGGPAGSLKGTRSASGWPVSLLGIWPINDSFDVFARGGVFIGDVNAKANLKYSNGDPIGRIKSNGNSTTNFIGGLGADYKFMDTWGARAEWQYVPSMGNSNTGGTGDFNVFMFSVNYSF